MSELELNELKEFIELLSIPLIRLIQKIPVQTKSEIENPNSEIKILFNRYNWDLNIYPFR